MYSHIHIYLHQDQLRGNPILMLATHHPLQVPAWQDRQSRGDGRGIQARVECAQPADRATTQKLRLCLLARLVLFQCVSLRCVLRYVKSRQITNFLIPHNKFRDTMPQMKPPCSERHVRSHNKQRLRLYSDARSTKHTQHHAGVTEAGWHCIRFGLVTKDTDLEELIAVVMSTGKQIEASSKVT